MLRDSLQLVRREPAFALYLAALATLGFKWLSPVSPLYERGIWSDVLVAASAAAWAWALARSGRKPRIRAFHVGLGLYLAAGAFSAAFATHHGTAALNLLLMAELCVLALLTSEFASDPRRLNAIVLVVVVVSLYTAALAAAGLGLFYAGIHTSLLGAYGKLTPASDYARVAAGFESGPLLSSFCIFASAVVARRDVAVPPGLRLGTQIALGALVVLTFSRAVIGFATALVIRAAYERRSSRRVRVAAVAFVVASIGVLALLSAGRLHLDPSRPATARYTLPDPHGRRENAAASLDTLADHPFVGTGPGSLPGHGDEARAHLTPLNIAATMGLPALAAMTFLLAALWRNRRRPTPIATWSGLAGLGIDGLGQDIDHFRHVWVLIGFADADRRPEVATRAPPRQE
jgi:hypothetical protein